MFRLVHRFQELKDPKSHRVGQWFLYHPWRESLKSLSGLHERLHLPKNALL